MEFLTRFAIRYYQLMYGVLFMATMNISLPNRMKARVESRLDRAEFSNTSDYVRHLIRRGQELPGCGAGRLLLDRPKCIGCFFLKTSRRYQNRYPARLPEKSSLIQGDFSCTVQGGCGRFNMNPIKCNSEFISGVYDE